MIRLLRGESYAPYLVRVVWCSNLTEMRIVETPQLYTLSFMHWTARAGGVSMRINVKGGWFR